MSTPRLSFTPVRDSYTLVPAYNTVESRLDGGKSRKRRDFLGGIHVITPTWVLKGTEYTSFMGFFNEEVLDGSLQFIGNFLTTVGITCEHKCTVIGGQPKLTGQSGDAFFVSATLEVTPNPTKANTVAFQNAGGEGRVLDIGSFNGTYLGDLSEFPVGGIVRIVQSRQTRGTWGGTFIDVDGVYTIQSKITSSNMQLVSASGVNTGWTTLGTLTPAQTATGVGACILIPQ